MAHFLAQARLPYFTNVARDVAVNTFHFSAPDNTAALAGAVAGKVIQFYTQAGVVDGDKIGGFLSPVVKRTAGALEVKVYDMSQPKPRVPVAITTGTVPMALNGDALPLEIAVCASYKSAYTAGISNARLRGRIYLGPLNAAAITNGTSSTFPAVSSRFITAISNSCKILSQDSGNGIRWAVYSRVGTMLNTIDSGWIDNEPDTQRRRQEGPTSRSVWLTPGA